MTAPPTGSGSRTHRTVHGRRIAAPADVVYDLVADVTRWPVLFGPSLHVDVLERSEHHERFQLWALVNGEVKTWTSRRALDAGRRRITFEQERSQPPIASMGGEWRVEPLGGPGDGVELVLEHSFSVVGDDPETMAQLAAGVDRNSREELAALARVAELGPGLDEVVVAFDDDVELPAGLGDVYDFVHRSDLWPERLPHVERVALHELAPDVQDMEMDTLTPEGNRHTTHSIRICFPRGRIVYKQLVPPALLLGHSGAWRFAATSGDATVVTARHMVAIDPGKVEEVLGAGHTLADARAYVREALGANSRATLTHAGRHPSPASP